MALELGVIIWVLMGWQFTLAKFVGGPIMIALLVLFLRRAMTPARLLEEQVVELKIVDRASVTRSGGR